MNGLSDCNSFGSSELKRQMVVIKIMSEIEPAGTKLLVSLEPWSLECLLQEYFHQPTKITATVNLVLDTTQRKNENLFV